MADGRRGSKPENESCGPPWARFGYAEYEPMAGGEASGTDGTLSDSGVNEDSTAAGRVAPLRFRAERLFDRGHSPFCQTGAWLQFASAAVPCYA